MSWQSNKIRPDGRIAGSECTATGSDRRNNGGALARTLVEKRERERDTTWLPLPGLESELDVEVPGTHADRTWCAESECNRDAIGSWVGEKKCHIRQFHTILDGCRTGSHVRIAIAERPRRPGAPNTRKFPHNKPVANQGPSRPVRRRRIDSKSALYLYNYVLSTCHLLIRGRNKIKFGLPGMPSNGKRLILLHFIYVHLRCLKYF